MNPKNWFRSVRADFHNSKIPYRIHDGHVVSGDGVKIVDSDSLQKYLDRGQFCIRDRPRSEPEPRTKHRPELGNDWQDLSLITREFKRSVNPPPEVWGRWDKVIKRAAARWFFGNRNLTRLHGLELEDAVSYARTWACSYWTLYAVDDNVQDLKLLTVNLRQRFGRLTQLLTRYSELVFPDWGVVSVDKDAVADDAEEEAPAPAKPKKNQLNKALAKLPHSQQLQEMETAASNYYICKDARVLAQRWLKRHKLKCEICKAEILTSTSNVSGDNAREEA